ncbi:nucleotidyltransferase family protein [Salipaludibacillus sp. HK11]|uniref:nucleotidyltransferase family protein n=1 Tax=Salipaludibacillus sp. HK11 TaxID=3394320 RepID=UPI0039FDA481
MKSEEDVIQLVKEDQWMMGILTVANSLNLPDWWVCAGFVRTKIWDKLHGYHERTPLADVDVIYFDRGNVNKSEEKKLEKQLTEILPNVPWSVKNQARMHMINNLPPYISSVDAIAKFPETVTALGVKLDKDERVVLTAPYGIEDVIDMEVRPTNFFKRTNERIDVYEQRMMKKNWKAKWDKVNVHHIESIKRERARS